MPFRPRGHSFTGDERGSFSILAIYFLIGGLVALGVAVDYANAFRMRESMQTAVNATALAAVIDLPSEADAKREGMLIASRNLSYTDYEDALTESDFTFGFYNANSGKFVKGKKPYNAVYVEMIRSTERQNALPTYIAFLAGRDSYDIRVSAMALATGICSGGGFFSDMNVYSGSNNSYTNFCLYGKDGVKIGSDTSADPGVKIEMQDLGTFEQGGSNVGVNEALNETTYNLTLYDAIPGIVANMQAGSLQDLPSYITYGPVYLDDITDTTPLDSNTLYIVENVADLGSDRDLRDIAIVAQKEVKVGSYNTLKNVFFASMDKVLLGSNNTFGGADYCASGKYSSFLYSGSNIEFGSNNLLRGLEMGSLADIKLGSDVGTVEGVRAVAKGIIDYGSADEFTGCHLISLNETYSRFALIR